MTGTHDVPDPDTPLLADALRAAGHAVDVRDWRDPTVDWSTARVTVLRSPWDYIDHFPEFLAWAERVSGASDLWNPLAIVRWNTHKAYLLDLAARGAPIVPTVVLLGGSAASLDGICDAQGWNAVVVKPAVASGAKGARRGRRGRSRRAGAPRRAAGSRRRAGAAVRSGGGRRGGVVGHSRRRPRGSCAPEGARAR